MTEQTVETAAIERELFKPLKFYQRTVPKEKLITTFLMQAYNYWLNIPEDKFKEIEDIAKCCFLTNTILNDILDDSKKRFDKPAVHVMYGLPSAINSAIYGNLMNLRALTDKNDDETVDMCIKNIEAGIIAMGLATYWRENMICPTEEDYLDNSKLLSAFGMHGLTVSLMQHYSENKTDYSSIVDNIGIFSQIYDEYADLCIKNEDKEFGANVTKGKFGFPTVHAIHSCPDKTEIIEILQMKTEDISLKKQYISLLEETGSLQYTRNILTKLRDDLLENIERVGGNPLLVNYINSMKF